MSYPELPNNRIIVNGIDLSIRFGLIMTDDYELSPPAYKSYQIDVPGSDSFIDLTSSVTGFPAYSNRSQVFNMVVIYPENFEKTKTDLCDFLHGKDFYYVLTLDPEYTYHGRFSVDKYSKALDYGVIRIVIDAKPYKIKPSKTYRLNAAGGRMFSFVSGRKPVRPIMEVSTPTTVVFDGKEITVPVGSWRLNDVLFVEGRNDIYINSFPMLDTLWSDLGQDGKNMMTWDQASKYRWDELARINLNSGDVPQSWDDLSLKSWDSLSDKRWSDLDWRPSEIVSETVFLKYDWGDL